MNTEQILEQRQQTHGDFHRVSAIAQLLKATVAGPDMSPAQKEALDMICSKLARIARGNANEPDHWRDIAGYATLVVRDMETAQSESHA